MKKQLVSTTAIVIAVVAVSPLRAQLSGDRDQIWKRNLPQGEERFGEVLVAGDFNGDGYDDLAIGNPHRDVGGKSDAGAVMA